MKRLHELKQEKEQLALEVEREEELLTNTLQKKLLQVRQEKIDLENKLENEQEYIVNKLQKQLENAKKEKHLLEIEIQKEEKTKHFFLQQLALEKIHLENELEQEQEFLVNRLQKQLILSQKIAKQNKIQLIQQIFDQIQCKIEIYRLQFNGFEDFFVLLEKEMEQLKKEQLINIQNTNLDTSTINTDENKSPLRHHSLSRRSSSSLSITALPSPRVEEEEEEEKIKQQQQQQQKKQNDP
jgi:coiled-coil domain-containing protein 6